jgi:hypothetical protein
LRARAMPEDEMFDHEIVVLPPWDGRG